MLAVRLELTLPEAHRSGWSSLAALEATRTSYAVCRPPDSCQLRVGVASPSPIGLVSVFTRSACAVTALSPGPAGARPAPTSSAPHATPSATTWRFLIDLMITASPPQTNRPLSIRCDCTQGPLVSHPGKSLIVTL